MASTATYIQGAGQNYILQSTSSAAFGNWVPVHPSIRNITFQAVETGSSALVSVSGSVSVQASNDGVNPIATTLGVITFSSAASPGSDGFSIDAHWNYVRAYINSGNTQSSGSTFSVFCSAHSFD